MSKSEPVGCLTVLLQLFGIRLDGKAESSVLLPYRLRDDFLSPAELAFYRVLLLSLEGSSLICPKVNLADIFFVVRSSESQIYRNKIDRKHVDFLLCDPQSLKPLLGIELDDSSHDRHDRQERDELVDQVFAAAQLPLLRIRAAAKYSPHAIAQQVREALSRSEPLRILGSSPSGIPDCPKCHVAMTKRRARKAGQEGSEFWGCVNYPKCRETVPLEQ
jgi:hypothetical protein